MLEPKADAASARCRINSIQYRRRSKSVQEGVPALSGHCARLTAGARDPGDYCRAAKLSHPRGHSSDKRSVEPGRSTIEWPTPLADEATLIPTTNHQPPLTSYQPPATNHQSPATSHQPPATNHQSPYGSSLRPARIRIAFLELPAEGLELVRVVAAAEFRHAGPVESFRRSIGIREVGDDRLEFLTRGLPVLLIDRHESQTQVQPGEEFAARQEALDAIGVGAVRRENEDRGRPANIESLPHRRLLLHMDPDRQELP